MQVHVVGPPAAGHALSEHVRVCVQLPVVPAPQTWLWDNAGDGVWTQAGGGGGAHVLLSSHRAPVLAQLDHANAPVGAAHDAARASSVRNVCAPTV